MFKTAIVITLGMAFMAFSATYAETYAEAAPAPAHCHVVVLAVHEFGAASCEDLLNMLNQACTDNYVEGTPAMAQCRSAAQEDYSNCLKDQRQCNPGAMGSMLGC